MGRPSRDEVLLEVARIFGQRMTCERAKIGAVIAMDGRIISTGYGGVPSGLPHCSPDVCDISKPCTRTVHAEANAIAFAARHGVAVEGATLYCTYSPCLECAKLIINAGIKRVIYETPYRKTDGIDLLHEAGFTALSVAPSSGLGDRPGS